MRTELKNKPDYEVVIIGGGPSGLTAGLYASRGRLNSLLIEKGLFGGQMINAELIENYPGFPKGIAGAELGQLMHEQATKYGLKTVSSEVAGLEVTGKQRIIKTTEGNLSAKAVIIAGGSERGKLDIPGEKELAGKGVSYCATCDGALFKEVPVAVIGGGDSAVTEALHLAKFASAVTLIHRRDQLRASRILQEKASSEPKIKFLWNSVIEAIEGEGLVKRVKVRQVITGEESSLDVAGVFVSVGLKPNTEFLKGILPLDPVGHIITNENMETGIGGIFAAGDIRHDSARQAVTAAGDGATAAIYAEKFLSR